MNLNLGYTQELIKAAKEKGLLRNQLAYLLATAYHETAHTMKPVAEGYWIKNAEAWRKKNLRYYPWYGRGYVQLTWEANYKRASEELGVDLIKNKDLAMDPTIAAKIAVEGMVEGWFVPGQKLSKYITLQKSDYVGARRIINGTDKAKLIAGYAVQYDADLGKLGYGKE
jgi:putative chitinase